MIRSVRAQACVFLVMACLLGTAPAAAETGGVTMSATIDDRDIGKATAGEPIRLDPDGSIGVAIGLTNNTDAAIDIRRVELAGHVLGLTFFAYSTAVEMSLAPGKSESLRYRLELSGLAGQATGLIGAELAVIGTDNKAVASVETVTDVRGSLRSVYGLFGIALAVLTALALADTAFAIARHRLSANRWQRGVRVLAPGVGIGLVFGFTASVARWWVPDTGLWLAVTGVSATVAFLLGYCSPTPEVSAGEDELAEYLRAGAEGGGAGYAEAAGPGYGEAAGRGYVEGAGPRYGEASGPGFVEGSGPGYAEGVGQSYSEGAGPGYGEGSGLGYGEGSGPRFGEGSGPGYGEAIGPGYGEGSGPAYRDPSVRGYGEGVGPDYAEEVGPRSAEGTDPEYGEASADTVRFPPKGSAQ